MPPTTGSPPLATVAVKITGSPKIDGVPFEETTVVDSACPTAWLRLSELVSSAAVPRYAAVIVCGPTVNVAVS